MTYRSVNVLVLAALLLSLAAPVAAAPEAAIPAQRPVPGQPGARNDVPALRAQAPVKPSTARNRAAGEVIGETDPGGASPAIYIARLDGAPLASYAGGVDSLPATSPVATGAAALDVGAVASTAYLGYLGSQQVTALDAINRALGRNVEVKFVYSYAFNGFALVLTPAEARIVAQQAGVRSVERDFLRQPVTDAGPTWVGAPGYWDGASTGGLGSTFGEGMVAGVIDTGINFASNSFAQVDAQGYRHTNPRGRFYGVCDPNSSQYNAAFICNSKLIGAWDFVDAVSNESDGPEDSDGHGSHTASTTAGNAVMATLLAPTTSYEARLSGVAPRANIIAYDACAVGCSGSALVRSIDQAVADGVDVINYSIGGGSSDPWLSADAIAFLGAHDAGIVAAVAAGNAGPSPSTMSSPANAPWVIASAAMTHDRVFANGVISMTGGAAPLADLPGKSVTAAYGPASIVDAANYTSTLGMADPLCQAPFAAGALSGKIVVCLRGVNGRVAKGENVLAGGAVGMVLVNDEASGYSLNADTHVLPAVHLTYANGLLLKAWLASGTGHTGRIAGTAPNRNEANGDILAAFSSRGPDATAPNILKPDIGAPGVDILAAYRHPISYNVVSGTSMASPHTAGAALLLAKLHPTWTPSEIKSALMLASKTIDLYRDDGVTPTSPFDVGAGRLKLETVAGVGFVLDERSLNYELANPGTGGDPSQLNLPSLQQEACVGTCSWTRTLKSVVQSAEAYAVTVSTPASMTLSVTPSSFTLPAGGSQVITITADVGAAAMDSWIFGQVNFRKQATSNVAEPLAHFPVAVMSRAGVVPNYLTEVSIETRRSAGSYIVSGIRALTTPTLQKAIYLGVPATVEGSIPPDPMNGEPYDPEAEGVIMAAVVITDPTTVRLAVQVLDTTAVDLDLFVGVDRNGDGRPTLDEELCRSTSASWTELCVLKNSPPGNYWVLLQNWQGSGAATDDFTMAITKVARGKSSAELTVSGPESTQLGTPFPVQINWDFVDLVEGNVVLALLELGTDAGNPNNIASLPVTLDRMRDDVAVAAISDNLVTGAYGLPGDLVTFTVSLEPEPTAIGPVDYRITATLPAGMTYVPGAAISRATGAEANVEPVVDGNRLIWTLPGIETAPQYVMSTNDPARNDYDPTCDTFLGGFIHLEDYGIDVRSEISGTGFAFSIDQFYGGTQPYNFFGTNHSQLYLTSNALLSVIGMDPALRTGANAPIPTAALPNSLMAPYWNAFRVVYDPLAQTGVRIAGALGGDVMVVEYDGLQSVANPAASFDVEAIVARQVRNDMPEIVFAYDGITGTLPAGVIGVENATGTGGVAFTGAIGDGLVICYDWKPDRAVLEYRARIDSNSATDVSKVIVHDHSLSAPGAKTAQAVQEIFVTGVVLGIGISGPTRLSPGVPISYTLTVSNTGSQAASNVNVRTVLPLGAEHVRGGTLDGRTVAWQIPSLPSGARAMVEYSVLMRNTPATAAMLPEVTASIVGGEEAEAGAWPWMAAIVNARTADTYAGQFCGGSLIHAEWVLTAAHCVTNRQGVPDVPSTIDVVVGRHDLTTSAGQRIPVGEIRVHPGYEVAAAFDADIALLHLAQPAVLTTTVQPIALLPNARAGLLQPNMPVTVTGWGTRTYNEPDYPAKLYQVVVPLFEQAVCRINYASAGAEITDNMLCAGMAQGGKDSCQGDSGGPLVVADGMGWLQAGIVSWGQACALPQLPGVYTRVDRFADWVNDESSTLSTGAFSAYTESLGDFGGHWVVGTGRIKTLVKPNITYLPAIKR